MDLPGAARIDCHVHSRYSPDGRGDLHELVKVAQSKGLTGLCVTDHNVYGMAHLIKQTKIKDFLVVPGMEISVQEGHCLALGVREPVPARMPLLETLERIRYAGGIGVPSHPFRGIHGVGEVAVNGALKELRALEVYNARDGPKKSNVRTQELAKKHGLGGTGGSDAHNIFEVGNAFCVLKEPADSVDAFLNQIEKRMTWGQGVPTPRMRIFLQNFKNGWLWMRRGFRSI